MTGNSRTRSSGKPAAQMLAMKYGTIVADPPWHYPYGHPAATHRRDRHPERKRTRLRSVTPAKFLGRKLDPEELTEIERERVRRAFLHGVEIEG